jgi:hypothetical protein
MSQLLLPVAPEGRKSIAQGVSPGVPKPETLSPEGAEEPEGGILSPLRGSLRAALDCPRLAPWALSSRPSGAEGFIADKFFSLIRK